MGDWDVVSDTGDGKVVTRAKACFLEFARRASEFWQIKKYQKRILMLQFPIIPLSPKGLAKKKCLFCFSGGLAAAEVRKF